MADTLEQSVARMTVSINEVIAVLHKITEAASLTAAQIEAFMLLVKLGEVEDEQSS